MRKQFTAVALTLGMALAGLLMVTRDVHAQATASASLQGTIVDKSQAVLTGADVTITYKATGATRSTKTSASGEYRFDSLSAGIYNIKANAPGFATAEAKDVELLVGATATQNLALTPGAVSETIEVNATAPLVDQQKMDVSVNITPQQILSLIHI